MDRRSFIRYGALAAAAVPIEARAADDVVDASIDARRPVGPLHHVWSECAGSDRAAITLRESWRRDLDRWRTEAGLKRVRFHGIFNDELGVFAPSIQNRGKLDAPNFQDVDRVYDGLVTRGLIPLVELGFMPQKIASGSASFGFYKGNITPPASLDAWAAFIREFVSHLIARYGIATIRTWAFEVWNEPNLAFFWTGDQQRYLEMYKVTAVAIKAIDPALQVGGPATSDAAWLPEFTRWCAQNSAPVDFISTHCYASDDQKKIFGTNLHLPQADVIPAAMRQARAQIDASPLRGLPLWLTEWSSDSPAVIAYVVTGCLPYLQLMSHWTLSSTYEELGVSDLLLKEGDTGYGAMVEQIAKPTFNTYKLLNRLGAVRLAGEGPVLASRSATGGIAALVWNLAAVRAPSGIPGVTQTRVVDGAARRVRLRCHGARPGQAVRLRFVDQARGSPLPAWRAMGSPSYPTLAQIAALRRAADIAPATVARLDARGAITVDLPPEGVALVEIG